MPRLSDEGTPKDSTMNKKQGGKVYKSAEFIEDSDLELEDLPQSNSIPQNLENMEIEVENIAKDNTRSKKLGSRPARSIVESDESEDDEIERPSKGSKKSKHAHQHYFQPQRKTTESDVESGSASSMEPPSKRKISAAADDDMTSLFGDSPKPKKNARTSGEKHPIKKTNTRTSKSQLASGGHEERIKKLKSLVNACGVRKPWAKIFKDIPNSSQQIAKLKEILTGLGMTGRMSMEQAKRIRAERELAKELEDVQSFEKSLLVHSRSSTTAPSHARVGPTDSNDENAGDDIKQQRRKIPALRSIEAFLEDQSDTD